MRIGSAIALRICFFTAVSLAAMPASGEVQWSGFFSAGTSFSDAKTTYTGGITKKPRFNEETFLGINLSDQVTDHWRVAAQFLARAGESDSSVKADWAFVSYQPSNQFSLSLGKQMIPLWLISRYLDVGLTYPWHTPPREVYTLFNLKSFTGASATYNLPVAFSDISLEIYGGDVLLEASPDAPTTSSKVRGESMAGGRLSLGAAGKSVSLAYNRAVWDLNLSEDIEFGRRKFEILAAGFSTDSGPYVIMGEYAMTRDLDEDRFSERSEILASEASSAAEAGNPELSGKLAAKSAMLKTKIGGAKAYYLTTGYRPEPVFVHLTLAKTEKPLTATSTRDESSATLGVNYDLDQHSVLKLSIRRAKLPEGSNGGFSSDPRDEKNDGTFQFTIYALGYSLVF